jgi:hypothetical protein
MRRGDGLLASCIRGAAFSFGRQTRILRVEPIGEAALERRQAAYGRRGGSNAGAGENRQKFAVSLMTRGGRRQTATFYCPRSEEKNMEGVFNNNSACFLAREKRRSVIHQAWA